MEKEKIIHQLMSLSEYEIPLFFSRFDTAKIPAIEVMNNKKEYICRQVELLKDFELELLYDDIIKVQTNKTFSEELALNSSSIKPSKIFISHSSDDKYYIEKFVLLLEHMGIKPEYLFCSSDSTYGVPLGIDIYEYLKEQFNKYNLHVIFVLSKNYYNSPAALNEMGAAWVLQSRETTILLPGFDHNDIKGVMNKNVIFIKLDEDHRNLKNRLDEFYADIISEFDLPKLAESKWGQYRDYFVDDISRSVRN